MSLWLCLRFDALPLEALLKQPELHDHRATVVVAQRLVIACDDTARCAGVIPGQSASTAQTLLTHYDTHIVQRRPEKEGALLQQLMTWAYGLSPHLQRWQNNALMIEVGSCLTLHHGLEALLQRIHNEMSLRGLTVKMGVAETRTAAWLLSHCEAHFACQPAQPLTERLLPLPLSLLSDEFPTVVDRLEKAGIRQFAQLLDIPLADIGKRCGITFVDWLNQLLGRRQEPTIDYQPPTRFQDTLWFGFDIHNRQELHPAMKQLLLHFCHFLVNTQLTSGVIEWHCLRPKGGKASFKVFSETAHRQSKVWLELSCLQLDNWSLPEGIEGLSLVANQLQEDLPAPQDLFHAGAHQASRYELADRLRSRLGLQAVGYLDFRREHLPEDTVIKTQSAHTISRPDTVALGQRPFWLLPEPHPVHQEGKKLYWNGILDIIHGPERIEDCWWSKPTSRDYYIAQTPQKQPIWLYQDRHNRRWYVHGLFA